ncbi:hypothetical protein KIN20_029506 [Parelaphostrongylus tenuis]|uniref:Reverse transcriptase domain-containing protein n=1 Tax=Parelaphostrongylus tenuis TaxID=148309 RepID=A0AAD5R2R1_PARTN|nr:hypothetical protein KIN20_029506 [Parelaphostrongylus tenuis]
MTGRSKISGQRQRAACRRSKKDEKGIHIDGNFLSNLRFADDIVLFSKSTTTTETMFNEVDKAGKKIGLCINRLKTHSIKN